MELLRNRWHSRVKVLAEKRERRHPGAKRPNAGNLTVGCRSRATQQMGIRGFFCTSTLLFTPSELVLKKNSDVVIVIHSMCAGVAQW